VHIKDAIEELLKGIALSDALADLLESDKDERALERSNFVDDNSFFKLAIARLRSRRHLGQLSTKQWLELVAGAEAHGSLVYLATPRAHAGKDGINLLCFSTDSLPSSLFAYRTFIYPHHLGGYGSTHWIEDAHSRPNVNNSITRGSKLVLSRTDYTQHERGTEIVRGLGLADMFE
jgi:hypothetical protein